MFNHCIRKLSPPTGLTWDSSGAFIDSSGNGGALVTTLAGSGLPAFADGIGVSAAFNFPSGVCLDTSGNLFVADASNRRIRKIVISTGVVTTLAGSGSAVFSDAPSGPGVAASFELPAGLALDTSGNLLIMDLLIRKVNISTGAVTTLAGAQRGLKNNNITLPSSQWRVASNSPGLLNTNVTSNGNTIINPHGTYFLYPSAICFLEGTTVLCFVNGNEEYVPVEKLTKETLVKTLRDGYKKIDMIAKQELFNPGTDERIEQRLYKCSTSRYPELTSDLYLTGCHSILVNTITDDERMKLTKQLGRIFVTDRKYRLTAFVDERTEPWNSEGKYTVWHFALDHENIMMNYGVFVNGGLLVESCSKHVLKNKSDMILL
jgi:sugar lactone lactonase YvrE